jgi:hypothetical protein
MYAVYLVSVPSSEIVDDFDYPIVITIAYCGITVTGNLIVQFRDRSRDVVGVQVSSSGRMAEANNIIVMKEAQLPVWIVFRLVPSR